jgi:N-acetylmuramate 1-kinase
MLELRPEAAPEADPLLAPREAIYALAQQAFGTGPIDLERMPGGASTRSFFRVRTDDGRSAVGMYVPDAGRAEEISAPDESGRRWPFLEVRDLLEERGVRVPALLGEDCDRGVLLVEDLGDQPLAEYVSEHPERREAIYRTAVADLARAQQGLAILPEGSIIRTRAFDESLLAWELHHFREWGLEARGHYLSDEDRRIFDGASERLARRIAALPRGFVHRDYQSRNLMVLGPNETLAWVDFQDALLGPRVYDLVALLNDSYQSFTEDFVEARLDEYAKYLGLGHPERIRIGEEFLLVTVQRKLKDAGRFVFIQHKKGDPSFLRFIEPTLDKVRRAMERLEGDPDIHALAALIERMLPRVTNSRGSSLPPDGP